jgi:histidinol-phosphate/aromatic aminotransferase/cobyric acid decarboxylase-like protein
MKKAQNIEGLKIFDNQCNFLLLKIPEPLLDFEELFLKRNILVDTYVYDDGCTYIRMPIKTHKFNARFIKTLKFNLDSPSSSE